MPTSTKPKQSKAKTLAAVQALIAGTNKHFPNGSLTFGNATYPAASLVTRLQGLITAMQTVDGLHAALKDALIAQHGERADVGPLIKAYTTYLHALYGNATQTLADFGLAPRKVPTPPSVETLAAAKAKAAATRKARGTAGKKQKLAIKGNVTGVDVTPITVTETSPAQPAHAAPSTAPTAASK